MVSGMFYRTQGDSTINFEVTGYCRGSGGQWGSSINNTWVFFRPDGNGHSDVAFTGIFNVKINKLIVSDVLPGKNNSAGSFYIDIEEIDTSEVIDEFVGFFWIYNWASSKLFINVEKAFDMPTYRFFGNDSSEEASENVFKINMTVGRYTPFSINGQKSKVEIIDSTIRRSSAGSDYNDIIYVNTGSLGTNVLKVINSTLYKKSIGSRTNSVVGLADPGGKYFFIDSNIILDGATGVNAISTTSATIPAPVTEVYFSNTKSNIDNSIEIEDIAQVSGFIANDEFLINIIDRL